MTGIINDLKVFKPKYRDAEKSHISDISTYKKIYDKSVNESYRYRFNNSCYSCINSCIFIYKTYVNLNQCI